MKDESQKEQRPSGNASLMWTLTALFFLRVLEQALVAFFIRRASEAR